MSKARYVVYEEFHRQKIKHAIFNTLRKAKMLESELRFKYCDASHTIYTKEE